MPTQPPRRPAPADFRITFRNIAKAYAISRARRPDLRCKNGFYGRSPVLKLQKPSWTNDSMRRVPNETGIFFAIWLDEPGLRRGRVHYNIHALKLRRLEEYALTSIDFATRFRAAFKPLQPRWPNVSTDYGPQTLMQGWIEITPNTFERDILRLMRHFGKVSTIIDRLLAQSAT